MKKKVIVLLVIAAIAALGWFLVGSPLVTFHQNEKMVEAAAKNYYELNSRELPTGQRVQTISLKKLYYDKFLEKDIYVPFQRKNCSLDKSWVKVKRVNDEYQYYTYLDCGILKSSIDATGPDVRLNGDTTISLGVGEEYQELGVKSVVDSVDGKLKTSEVVIKGSVDTSKIGTYEITYTALDSMDNKTTVTRTINVVQKLYQTIKKQLGDATNYVGRPDHNYIRLSNMLFRVYGVDENKNVIIVSGADVANVNYSKIEQWLDYYYKHLNGKTKKMIVPSKYCNMKVEEANVGTKECTSYTDNKKVYLPSIIEVNKAQGDNENFMKPGTMSWVANAQSDNKAYLTRNVFFFEEYGKSFLAYDVNENYGIRPMMVIKGGTLIKDGDGSYINPYTFGDTKPAKVGSLINKRFTGEYVEISGILYRIIDVLDDGTVKVVSNSSIGTTIGDMLFTANADSNKITYNPTDKSSVAYSINNRVTDYIDTKYFVKHEIEVPIYKNKIIYGEEESIKKYNVLLSAPNMYEMFSAKATVYRDSTSLSYWMLNTSKGNRIGAAVFDIGVPVSGEIDQYDKFGVRVVGFLKKNVIVNKGKGTIESPYQIQLS